MPDRDVPPKSDQPMPGEPLEPTDESGAPVIDDPAEDDEPEE